MLSQTKTKIFFVLFDFEEIEGEDLVEVSALIPVETRVSIVIMVVLTARAGVRIKA
jgi:hypothetical protein